MEVKRRGQGGKQKWAGCILYNRISILAKQVGGSVDLQVVVCVSPVL